MLHVCDDYTVYQTSVNASARSVSWNALPLRRSPIREGKHWCKGMQVSTARSNRPASSGLSVVDSTFSSYINKSRSTELSSKATSSNCPSAIDSWCQDGGLPPPPKSCERDLLIEPSSIPAGPARAWDVGLSDDDCSDEGKLYCSQRKKIIFKHRLQILRNSAPLMRLGISMEMYAEW